MKHLVLSALAAGCIFAGVAGSANATQLNYDYLDVRFGQVDVKDASEKLDAVEVEFSARPVQSLLIKGGITFGELGEADLDVSARTAYLGLGTVVPVHQKVDIIGSTAYRWTSLNLDYDDSEVALKGKANVDSWSTEFGIRTNPVAKLDLELTAGYERFLEAELRDVRASVGDLGESIDRVDITDELDSSDTFFRVGARYPISRTWDASFSTVRYSDFNIYSIGVRANF